MLNSNLFRPLLYNPSILYRRYAAAAAQKKHDVLDHFETDLNARILRIVERRVKERAKLMAQVTDMSSLVDISRSKQIKELESLQTAWDGWTRTRELLRETSALLSDPDPAMRSLAVDEHASLSAQVSRYIDDIFPSLLVSTSSTAHLSALMEFKSGVGGSESSLFLGELLRMYQRFANSMRWDSQIVTSNKTEDGGVKDAILEIRSPGAYDALRWESGVHRVQRVPATETSGRVHTSTVALVVLPLTEDVETSQTDDALFKMEDIRLEVMRARGAGGQHVNKTESAVRLTHVPTGITVSMQDERSQHQNRRRAFQILTARLMDQRLTKEMVERRAVRHNLVRTADRSEKIRTYNYAQDRVTDHRLGLSLMNLESVMEGDGLHTFIEALKKNQDEETMEMMLADP